MTRLRINAWRSPIRSLLIGLLLVVVAPGGGAVASVSPSFPAFVRDSLPVPAGSTDTLAAAYPFLDLSKNGIGNPDALATFFGKLDELAAGRRRRVRVVHIGDSHIQADLLTGPLRAWLQARFGAAGRGVVFPFALARSNSPLDLSVQSASAWEARRSIHQPGPPLGLCGISLRPAAAGAAFQLSLRDRYTYGQDYTFDRVTLFFETDGEGPAFAPVVDTVAGAAPAPAAAPRPRHHVVRAGETLYALSRRYGCSVALLQRWNGLRGSRIDIGQRLVVGHNGSVPAAAPAGPTLTPDSLFAGGARFTLPAPGARLVVRALGDGGQGGVLQGMLLENSRQAGLLYHAIGVNGVTYQHYNRAERFWDQLPDLRPELVIVSLGTNEALGGHFSAEAFRAEVETFLAELQRRLPGCSVLLTTNPDVLRRRRYDNAANLEVRRVILEAAGARGLAFWDLHGVMGGRGAVRQWRGANLAGADFIHFTKEGYRLQARLLFEALMNAYAARD